MGKMVGVWSSHTIQVVVVEAVVVVVLAVMIGNVMNVVSLVILLESAACALVHVDLEVGDVEVPVLSIVAVPVMGGGVTTLVENLPEVAAYLLVVDASSAGHLLTTGGAMSHLMLKVYHLAVVVVATAGPQHIVVMILLIQMELDTGLSRKYN